ncbi:MAG TPA: sensor histidine kinase [Actinomycetota bacterium]|nr:sensor histidine kinase [Actinomycetota bacterium]
MRGSSSESWLTFRLRAVAALGALVFALPLAAGSVGIYLAREELIGRVTEGQLATARTVAADIARSTQFATALVRAEARRPGMADAIGRRDGEAATTMLRETFATFPLYREITVYSADGTLVGAFPGAPPEPPSGVPSTSTRSVSEAEPAGEDAIMRVREPIDGGSGTVGVIVATVSFNKAIPELRTLRFGDTGSTTVVDRTGRVLITGEAARVGRTLPAEPQRALVREWKVGTARYYGELVRRDEMAAFVPVRGRPWAVMVTQGEEEALADIGRLQRGLAVGLMLLVGVGALIAFLLWQTLNRYEAGLRSRIDEQERLNGALDEFAARVAHDLRSPLGTMRMAAQVASRNPALDEPTRTTVEMVEGSAQRAIDLVEDLLALAKASGTPRYEPIDLGSLVSDAQVGIRDLTVLNRVGDLTVVADRVALRQSLVNLFNNAVKYASVEGRAEVLVEAEATEGSWVIRVSDRGPGLSAKEAATIFDAFTRGEGRGMSGGTGLGLSIVAAMAGAHGGRAAYEDRPGGGGVFVIELPRRDLPDQGDDVHSSRRAPARAKP